MALRRRRAQGARVRGFNRTRSRSGRANQHELAMAGGSGGCPRNRDRRVDVPIAARPDGQYTTRCAIHARCRARRNCRWTRSRRVLARWLDGCLRRPIGRARAHIRRALDGIASVAIAGTEDGGAPFFSPDGTWLGFSTASQLMKIPLQGGRPVVICDVAARFGATWGADGYIVFSARPQTGLLRVSAAGGTPEPITTLAPEDADNDHRYPTVRLRPASDRHGARRHRANCCPGSAHGDANGTRARQRVGCVLTNRHRARELFAMPFDVDTLAVTESAWPSRRRGERIQTAPAEYAFSRAGDLVYRLVSPVVRSSRSRSSI